MIFKIAYKKGNRISIKVKNNEGNDIWMGCSEKVFNWCRKSFKDGDEVDVEYTKKDGQYTASRVIKKDSSSTSSNEKEKEKTYSSESTPNSKSDKIIYPREYMKPKTPEEAKQMRACSILSSVCNAVNGLAGHIDPNNIGDIIESLYDKFTKKLP